MSKKLETGKLQQRFIDAQIRAVEEAERAVELSFSSELPYNRWFGPEILSHEKGAVDMSRLDEIGVVLFSHGRDLRYGKMPIAKIEKAWIDEKESKGKAIVTFDDDEDSERIYQKVTKGLIKGVSVGYTVSNWEEVAAGKKSINGKFAGPASIAVRWVPHEISIEPVPADPNVGIGRATDEALEGETQEGEYRAEESPEPVTDKLQEQRREFNKIKNKLLEV